MKIICLATVLLVIACTPQKPPLDDTQIIHGKSIIVPPEFDSVPKGEKNDTK